MSTYVLRLYITGRSYYAERSIENLHRICEQELQGRYELEIIDVLEHPQLAEKERIIATPMLVKELPPPLQRIVGDLSDRQRVLVNLQVEARPDHAQGDRA